MKNVVITVGPIPARLDSVKFLTNRFKGGLALKTAHYLRDKGHNVTIVAWKNTELKTDLPIVRINDVVDYYNTVLEMEADAYILAAAVANLMPSNPYEGKFPSHKYNVGDKFNIEFEIAPRVIDEIKKKHPRSALIGYKLYDGTEEDLIAAGKKTLFDSVANLVFANNPAWAKERKIALTQDGAVFNTTFDEHCHLIDKLIRSEFYSTRVVPQDVVLTDDEKYVVENYPSYPADGRTYGTFAVRREQGFVTTTRGKKNGNQAVAYVTEVDHTKRLIETTQKATLNAPLLDATFALNPELTILYHGHDIKGFNVHSEYEFAGSDGDIKFATYLNNGKPICLTHHGFLVGFETLEDFKAYVREQNDH